MKKRKKISRQMAFRSIILTSISVVLLIVLSIMILRRNLVKNSKEQLILEAHNYQYEVEDWIDHIIDPLNMVVNTIRNTDLKNDDEKLLNYLKNVTLKMHKALSSGMYVADSDNRFIDPTGYVPDPSVVIADREWFILGHTSEKMTLGNPYYGMDPYYGADVIMVSASAKIDEKTVASADITLTSIVERVKEIDVIGDGYAFIVDKSTGYILAHANDEYTGMTIDEMEDDFIRQSVTKVEVETQTVHELKDDKTTYFVTGNDIEGTNWMLVTCAKEDVLMSVLKKAEMILLVVGFNIIVGMGIVIGRMTQMTLKPVEEMTRLIGKITSGDFSERAKPTGNNEITTLSEYLNIFIDQMRETISRLSNISDYLKIQSHESTESSKEMLLSASVQKDSMQQMNTTVDEMARAIEEIAESAGKLAARVSEISGNSKEASDKIMSAVEDTESGKRDIEKVAVTITDIDRVMKELSIVVGDVGESAKAISAVTDIIGGIASQTNLLALNASIEAARAGEAGKGFAVVATEIGNLAAMCADSVNQIGNQIGRIQTQVEEVVEKTTESVKDVELSKKLADETKDSFRKIYDSISATRELIDDVTRKIVQVDEVSTSIAAITEEQSAGAEEILATSENLFQQAIMIEENSSNVNGISQNIGRSAEDIYEQLSSFKI
ncbi:MAG: methyl-accepting chemotaxis protein [Lachnospiraceae bacterium]|nr:methyl-accepting chemotaxis protein [Lachnospiraceae bacterium]